MSAPTPDVVVVCGGRNYSDAAAVCRVLDALSPSVVIHGGATGADTLAGRWSAERAVPCVVMAAEWRRHGRAAGPIRNRAMAEELLRRELSGLRVAVVAFPGGNGTEHMKQTARDLGIWLIEYVGDSA